MEFYHEQMSSVAELLDAAMNDEVNRMEAAETREHRVSAWNRLTLLKELQAAVERDHA